MDQLITLTSNQNVITLENIYEKTIMFKIECDSNIDKEDYAISPSNSGEILALEDEEITINLLSQNKLL